MHVCRAYRIQAYVFAKLLKCEYVTLIGYPLSPSVTILDQKQCVIHAVKYLKSNAQLFQGTAPLRFILSGHSAGANLAALLLAEQLTTNYKYMDALVSMSGVYDLNLLKKYEIYRQMTNMSPMELAAGGGQNYDLCSPAHLLEKLPLGHVQPEMLVPVVLMHGLLDGTVPVSNSQRFAQVLGRFKGVGMEVHELYSKVCCLCNIP